MNGRTLASGMALGVACWLFVIAAALAFGAIH